MVADIRKYVQHISLSPDSIQNDEVSGSDRQGVLMQGVLLKSCLVNPEVSCPQAVAPLLKYLDEKLALLNDSLVKENLSRYQLGQWGRWDGAGPGSHPGNGPPGS